MLISPLQIQRLCDLVLDIISKNICGTFQLSGGNEISYFEFAKEMFGSDAKILPLVAEERRRHCSLKEHLPIA